MGIVESWIIAKSSVRRSLKRNKKRWIIGASIGASIALLLCAIVAYVVFFSPSMTWRLGGTLTEYVFGCTPSEFSTATLDAPDEISSFQKNAYTSSDGFLVVKMSYLQYIKLRDSEWINVFPELEDWPCINVSEDYSCITVTLTSEMRMWDDTKVKEFDDVLNTIIWRIHLRDMLNNMGKTNNHERIATYKEIVEETGVINIESEFVISKNRTDLITHHIWEW